MAHLIIKDRKLCVSARHLTTDAGGAPCVCGGTTGGISCDDPQPLCFEVILTGWGKSECLIDTCNALPGFGVLFSSTGAESVDGFNGTHIVTFDNNGGDHYCSVQSYFDQADGTRLVGIVYEAFSITLGLTCTAPDGTLYDEWHVNTMDIRGERQGGAGCSDGLLFRYSGDPIPLGNPITNSLDTDCATRPRLVIPGSVSVNAIGCENLPNPNIYVAQLCDNAATTILVDITDRPINNEWCIFGNEKYALTGTHGAGPVAAVQWADLPCPADPPAQWPVASECGNPGNTITFDPANRPTDGVTFIVSGRRYLPNGDESARLPSVGVWAPDSCPTIINCGDILDPNDPRCDTLEYQHCPQCQNQGSRDPIVVPGNQSNDGDHIPGLGDMVKRAIALTGMDRLAPTDCTACERRRIILNRWGDRVGRAILKRLGL